MNTYSNFKSFESYNTGRVVCLTQEIANSGEGKIFLTDCDGFLAKIYHQKQLTQERIAKLKTMLLCPPPDKAIIQHAHISIAWPSDLLLNQGLTIGYLMPLIADAVTAVISTHTELRMKWNIEFNYRHAVVAAENLASAVGAIHLAGHIIGDLKRENIMVTKNALISLIDTDSFQVFDKEQGIWHRCPVGTPEFTPPELASVNFASTSRNKHHDAFGLAVLIYYFLMSGQHPFEGVWRLQTDAPPITERIKKGLWVYGPHSIAEPGPTSFPLSALPSELQSLFRDCFTLGHNEPAKRPSAKEWWSALNRARATMTQCRLNPRHWYFPSYGCCVWCQRIKNIGIDFYPYIGPAAFTANALSDDTHIRLSHIRAHLGTEYAGSILILGGPGTGKTVLLACLAKYYQSPSADGVFISPESREAMEFRDLVFDSLQANSWPSATRGDLQQLLFSLHTPYGKCALKLFDLPGEVYLNTFARWLENDASASALRTEVTKANAALLLVSAKDIFGTVGHSQQRIDSARAACQYATFLKQQRHKPTLGLVITQVDGYECDIERAGGPFESVASHIPDLTNLHKDMDVFSIAAVAQTAAINGSTEPVPITGFRSYGFEALLNWMVIKFVLGGHRRSLNTSVWKSLFGGSKQ